MASAPPRPSQRRSSPREQEESIPLPRRSNSEALSTTSEDSQTVLLNRPASPSRQANEAAGQQQTPAQSTPRQENPEPRKCWICFGDETEDQPTTSEWRSPCSCALVAHEKCLLDWVAGLEAPNSRQHLGPGGKILCPQCKSEIRLERPRNLIVDGYRSLEYLGKWLVWPGVGAVTAHTLLLASSAHGINTIHTVFGPHDAAIILRPYLRWTSGIPYRTFRDIMATWPRVWHYSFGLPSIPVILILSRFNIADSFLPVMPMLFFATVSRTDDLMNVGHWPPSAALSFAMLPYFRSLYNAYYERVWGPKVRGWLKEVQPRGGNNGDANENGNDDGEDDDDLVLGGDGEFEVNLEIVEEVIERGPEHHPVPPPARERDPAPPLDAPPADAGPAGLRPVDAEQDGQAAPAPNVPLAANQVPPVHQHRHNRLAIDVKGTLEAVLGALIFPSIAAAMGDLLKHALPKSWVIPPLIRGRYGSRRVVGPTGLLQQQWGRSLIGGCLFVVAKDAIMLYVRWKMAQGHRKRKVLNYDREKKQYVRGSG